MKVWILPVIPSQDETEFTRYQVGHMQEAIERTRGIEGASIEISIYDPTTAKYASVFFDGTDFSFITSTNIEDVRVERVKQENKAKAETAKAKV